MGIVYPIALVVGAALVAVPTLVHFLARSRPVKVRYPTVRFLQEALKHRRALFRFRDLLVLMLRALAIILLAAAFARFFSKASSAIALEGNEPTVRVIILDASQSMEARRTVVQVFDSAKAAARKYVKYRPGLKADILLCGARAVPLFERVSENLSALEASLSSAAPRGEALDVKAALSAAVEMLTKAAKAGSRRELIIISDFQATNWKNAPFELIPKDATVRFEQVSLTGDVGNLAVCDVRAADPPRSGEPVRLVVAIGNFSSTEQQAALKVSVGDVVREVKAICPAWRTTPVTIDLGAAPAAQPGGSQDAPWICGAAALAGTRDVLSADDERPFAVPLERPRRYVILSRDDPASVATSRYFLERALGAGSEEIASAVDPAHLDADVLAGGDLIAMIDAGKLPAEAAKAVSALTARGGALLCVVSTMRDAENLLALEQALGGELRLPVAFSGDYPFSETPRRLKFIRTADKPFKVMSQNIELLRATEFAGGVASVQRTGGAPDDVVASYDDGSAALTVSPCGRGRVAVLNADLARSTLPASPLFVPLVQELADRLILSDAGRSSAAVVGLPLHVFLPASATGAQDTRIVGPAGPGDIYGAIEDTQTGMLWTWRAVERAGIYRVVQGKRLIHAVAAVSPESESDLRTVDPALLASGSSYAGKVEVRRTSTGVEQAEQRTEWWPWLTLAAMTCLLMELAVLKAFRS